MVDVEKNFKDFFPDGGANFELFNKCLVNAGTKFASYKNRYLIKDFKPTKEYPALMRYYSEKKIYDENYLSNSGDDFDVILGQTIKGYWNEYEEKRDINRNINNNHNHNLTMHIADNTSVDDFGRVCLDQETYFKSETNEV